MPRIKNKPQKFRYGLIGFFNTAFDFALLFVFEIIVGLPLVVANTLSTSAAFASSFTLNKKLAFKTSGTNVKREIVLFVSLTLFGLWVIQNIVIMIVRPLLPVDILQPEGTLFVAKLIATGFTLVWNYYMYSRVVFKHKPIDYSHPEAE